MKEKEFIKKRLMENESLFTKQELQKIDEEFEKNDIMYLIYKVASIDTEKLLKIN